MDVPAHEALCKSTEGAVRGNDSFVASLPRFHRDPSVNGVRGQKPAAEPQARTHTASARAANGGGARSEATGSERNAHRDQPSHVDPHSINTVDARTAWQPGSLGLACQVQDRSSCYARERECDITGVISHWRERKSLVNAGLAE